MSDEFAEMAMEAGLPPSQEERLYAAACHFAGLPVFTAVALANLIAPLVIWLVKKDTMPFVDAHGKESLNFQLTVLLAYAAGFALAFAFCLGVVLVGVVAILQIIFPIIAGIAAYGGKPYRYPLTLRMIK